MRGRPRPGRVLPMSIRGGLWNLGSSVIEGVENGSRKGFNRNRRPRSFPRPRDGWVREAEMREPRSYDAIIAYMYFCRLWHGRALLAELG